MSTEHISVAVGVVLIGFLVIDIYMSRRTEKAIQKAAADREASMAAYRAELHLFRVQLADDHAMLIQEKMNNLKGPP